MFFKILKKDLKRSKTMNIILFLFIILASVFVASGLNNLVSVINGMNYFMDMAAGEKSDYFMIVSGVKDTTEMEKKLDKAKSVKSYDYDKYYAYSEEVWDEAGKKLDWNGAILLQSPESSYLKFYDAEDNEITSVDKGHIYITKKFFNRFNVEPGDKITIKLGKEKKDFIIDGGLKDAMLGSDMVGGYRFFVNDDDLKKYYESNDAESRVSAVIYMESDDVDSINTELKDLEGNEGGYPRSALYISRIVDIMVAFIIVILSICLIIVSFVIIRFSIGFTIQDDFREIGVMKAIGLRNFKIRTLYLTKYTALAFVGTIIGLIISYPFGSMLIKSVAEGIVLGNNFGYFTNIIGSTLVFAVIVWLAFVSTGRVKKMTPVDAIRSGEAGERFRKKRGLRISRSHTKNTSFLSWNDILSSPKRYLNIIISFGICTMFLLILSNFTATLDSPVLADAISHASDIYVDNENAQTVDIQKLIDEYPEELENSDILDKKKLEPSFFVRYEKGKEMYEGYLKLVEEKLAEEGMPAKVFNDTIFNYNFSFNGNDYNYSFMDIIGNRYGDYKITEGSSPQNINEIAITQNVRETFGMDIGDTIEVDFDGEKEKCTVTGIFNCMNNMGNQIRLYDDAPTKMSHYIGSMSVQISFTDNPSQEEINSRRDRIKEILDTEDVKNKKDATVENMATLDAMEAVEKLLMAITVIVVILVTVMMERSFIAKETKQIAILKAMGFRDSEVIKWQVIRFAVLAVIAVVIAIALSVPATKLAIGSVFNMIGASKIDWIFDFRSMAKYPAVLVAITVVITWITAQYTGTVKARDTASIE